MPSIKTILNIDDPKIWSLNFSDLIIV